LSTSDRRILKPANTSSAARPCLRYTNRSIIPASRKYRARRPDRAQHEQGIEIG
jgi:hypothetical protein